MTHDEYRVSLFKRKIRDALPMLLGIRFRRSKGRGHLCIVPSDWYSVREEVIEYIPAQLKKAGIEFHPVHDMFGIAEALGVPTGLDCFSIPIDQEALPERSRPTNKVDKT